MVGGAGNAAVVTSNTCFATPGSEAGSGVGSHPPEEVYSRLVGDLCFSQVPRGEMVESMGTAPI
jgi:hypothetical protein